MHTDDIIPKICSRAILQRLTSFLNFCSGAVQCNANCDTLCCLEWTLLDLGLVLGLRGLDLGLGLDNPTICDTTPFNCDSLWSSLKCNWGFSLNLSGQRILLFRSVHIYSAWPSFVLLSHLSVFINETWWEEFTQNVTSQVSWSLFLSTQEELWGKIVESQGSGSRNKYQVSILSHLY